MNDITSLQVQVVELQRLITASGDDPILAPQLAKRLARAQEELNSAKQQPGMLIPKEIQSLPRAAIFLRGGNVHGSVGIRPALAGEALIQYEKMFVEQALHDEREHARRAGRHRRPRGAIAPNLLFTNTPRGSFGLEFVAQETGDGSLLGVHAQSLTNIAEHLVRLTEANQESLGDVVQKVPARVLQPLRQFLKVLADNGTELRFAFPDRGAQQISGDKIRIAAEQLERDVSQDIEEVAGVFRGVTRESGFFDLRVGADKVLSGFVADDLTEEDLERIDKLTNRQCVARLQKTVVTKISGSPVITFVLLDAKDPGLRLE